MKQITLTLNDADFARANAALKIGGFGGVKSAVKEWIKNFSDDPDHLAWHAPIVRAGVADAKAGRVLTAAKVQQNLDKLYQTAMRKK